MVDDVIGRLRSAVALFDEAHGPARKAATARTVLSLVRELLAEVDGVRQSGGLQYHVNVEPLGPPNPADGELPEGVTIL